MGFPLAARLLQAGADVGVYNRTRAKAEPLADLGAQIVDTPVELADRDIVFTMVSGPEDFRAVTTGDGGVLADDDVAPAILVDSSTVSSEVSEEVRHSGSQRGTQLLALPVSGNGKVVKAGLATFAASGPEDAYATVRPYVEALGRSVHYVGEGDRARLVKIAHNLLLGAVTQSLVETTLLVQGAGIARADYLSFLNDSVMGSMFTQYKTPTLVGLDWTTTFTLPLLRKDLDLGLAAAAESGVSLPLTACAREQVQTGIDEGHVEDDFAVLLEVQAQAAGLELVPEDEAAVSDGLAPAADVAAAR
jgi:3-hydroxyisobutyrate dehydrogenase-like beta-hydroxyacid dehydrogenase